MHNIIPVIVGVIVGGMYFQVKTTIGGELVRTLCEDKQEQLAHQGQALDCPCRTVQGSNLASAHSSSWVAWSPLVPSPPYPTLHTRSGSVSASEPEGTTIRVRGSRPSSYSTSCRCASCPPLCSASSSSEFSLPGACARDQSVDLRSPATAAGWSDWPRMRPTSSSFS